MNENVKTYDLAVSGGTIISLEDEKRLIPDSLLLIDKGIIAYAGPLDKAPVYQAIKAISAKGKYILPAFFNQHTHLSVSLFRGLGTDMKLKDWLQKAIWPLEQAYSNPDNVYLGSLMSLIEMIRNGTGTLANMDFHNLSVGKALVESGLRGFLGEGLFDKTSPSGKHPEETFSYTENLIQEFADNDLISIYLAPHAPFSCSPELYEKTGELASKLDIHVGTHLCETKWEVENIKKKYGLSPVELLDRTGVFDNHFVAYHGIHIDDHDIEILKKKNVSVIHNPHSNMVLGSGVCPVPELLEKGVLVGLGTDSAASNNHLSILREMQTAYLIHKGIKRDATIMKADEVLRMASTTGYEIYRMKGLGRVSKDYKADFQIINLNSINNLPIIDPVGSILTSAHMQNIETLVVNGEIIMEDRRIINIDEDLIIREARKFGKKVKKEFPRLFTMNEEGAEND